MDQLAAIRRGYVVGLAPFGDSRERQHVPGLALLDVSNKIVGMQALHYNDDCARLLIVEAAPERVVVPVVNRTAPGFRQGVIRLQRVIDDDNISAAASEH